MNNSEFKAIRHSLGKTQTQLAALLCISSKAVQSFEQGWRKVPGTVQRHLLFLASCKLSADIETDPCWETRKCPVELRDRCAAWELRVGKSCWFVTGTVCGGAVQKNWDEKIRKCRRCGVFRSSVPGA